jgi:hypothetical protein
MQPTMTWAASTATSAASPRDASPRLASPRLAATLTLYLNLTLILTLYLKPNPNPNPNPKPNPRIRTPSAPKCCCQHLGLTHRSPPPAAGLPPSIARHASTPAQMRPFFQALAPAQRARACRTMDDMTEWAGELGLGSPGGNLIADADQWHGQPSDEERAAVAALAAGSAARADASHVTTYVDRLRTGLHWLALFRELVPSRRLLLPLGGAAHHAHALHNDMTFDLIRAFVRDHGSIRAGMLGETIRGDSVGAVVSTLRAYATLQARYSLMPSGFNIAGPRVATQMRREDGPSGERALRLGLGVEQFALLDRRGFDRSSPRGLMDHGAALTLFAVTGRGGEVGLVEGRKPAEWRADTSPVLADVDWSRQPCAASANRAWCYIAWFPIKDPSARHSKVVTPIVRRHDGAFGSDPACAYDALLTVYNGRRASLLPGADLASVPLFAHASGKVYTTADSRRIAKAIATAVGIDPATVGASSFRIGSATAIYRAFGADGKRKLLEAGRWHTDIGFIYARLTEASALETARRNMEGGAGPTVEQATGRAQQRA